MIAIDKLIDFLWSNDTENFFLLSFMRFVLFADVAYSFIADSVRCTKIYFFLFILCLTGNNFLILFYDLMILIKK